MSFCNVFQTSVFSGQRLNNMNRFPPVAVATDICIFLYLVMVFKENLSTLNFSFYSTRAYSYFWTAIDIAC